MTQLKENKVLLAYCNKAGNVYEYPVYPAFRSGSRILKVVPGELIRLPEGSILFSLPERYPLYYNKRKKSYDSIKSVKNEEAWAASAFLSSGYLRTYLPAYIKKDNAPLLPLWAYTGVVIIDGDFFVPAIRIDNDPRSDPSIHNNDDELKNTIEIFETEYPQNRLVRQLAYCSTEYRCLCSRNFFLGRFEAPVPTSLYCNSNCIGCLSYQCDSGFQSSQNRLDFMPTPEEIAEVIIHHVKNTDSAVVSFGQGCEGEPLLRARDLSKAVNMVRNKTDMGTININTNGSMPDMVRLLIDSGLDSIRISLNSPTKIYYDRYYRQKAYQFEDVLRSIETAIEAGIFVSINLFFLPGFTDMESEVESLIGFLERFPVDMIQTRNLNMDPDYYLDCIGFEESDPIGITKLLKIIRDKFRVRLGYYNPPKETF